VNRREKILGAVVLSLVAAFIGSKWFGRFQASVAARRSAVQDAKVRLADVNLALAEGRSAVQQLETWQVRSLPNNRERALSLYKAWLLAKARDAGLAVNDIKPAARTINSAAYSTIGYQIDATGSLPAVTAMLYEFYRSTKLHQITRLRLTRPAGGSQQLEVDLEVEALSLPGAIETDRLPEGDSERLELASLEAYQKSLSERDLASLYAPPRPPRQTAERRERPAPPKFDDAEHAYFTAAVGNGQGWQAWINVRTTGETLHLAAGDPLKVGTLEGEVVSVEPRTLVLKNGDKTLRVALGQTLRGGKELDADAAAPAEAPAEHPES
jgi:hypothetical protein